MHSFTLEELISICRRAKMEDDCPNEAFDPMFWDDLTGFLERLKALQGG